MGRITSSRLLLRPWSEDDADFLLDMESRREVVRFLGGSNIETASSNESGDQAVDVLVRI